MSEPPLTAPGEPGVPGDGPLAATVVLPASSPAGPSAGMVPAGWYGKLPLLGDFASRRLPERFVDAWDTWLQPSLAKTKESIGEDWLDLYLTFPVWRFVMPVGAIGDCGWIGVLLPSVDRVGRCFPLTICEPASRSALEGAGLVGIDRHLDALAAAGVGALEAGSVDDLERRLVTLAPLEGAVPAATRTVDLRAWSARYPGGGPETSPRAAWPLGCSVEAVLASAASRFVIAALGGRVLWWSPPSSPDGEGAMRLEPYPFSDRLLGNLIGSN